jgi:hypothetical protein
MARMGKGAPQPRDKARGEERDRGTEPWGSRFSRRSFLPTTVPIYSVSRLGRHRRERREARIKTRGEHLPVRLTAAPCRRQS